MRYKYFFVMAIKNNNIETFLVRIQLTKKTNECLWYEDASGRREEMRKHFHKYILVIRR